MRNTFLTVLFAFASVAMTFAQSGTTMLSDVYIVDQYGGYVICYGPEEEPYPVRPGDKISPNSRLMLTDGATVKLYYEHMGKTKLFTVDDATTTNGEGFVEVRDVLTGEGDAVDTDDSKNPSDDDVIVRRGYISEYWLKVGQAVAQSETQSAGVYGWASGPEKAGASSGPIKGYGKRFSDARAAINQKTLSGEIPNEEVCFTWERKSLEPVCLKIATLDGDEVFSADVRSNEMCVDLSRLALDTDEAYQWYVVACESGDVISDPVKFKLLEDEVRAATVSDIRGYAGVSDGGSNCDDLKTMLMEASALADRGLIYDANRKYQEVLRRIEEAKEMEYIANALYSDFVKEVEDEGSRR